MRLDRIDFAVAATVLALIAEDAFANKPAAPAPIAGIGYGALVLAAFGYRKLRTRIGR
jgi:hypothetical protein